MKKKLNRKLCVYDRKNSEKRKEKRIHLYIQEQKDRKNEKKIYSMGSSNYPTNNVKRETTLL